MSDIYPSSCIIDFVQCPTCGRKTVDAIPHGPFCSEACLLPVKIAKQKRYILDKICWTDGKNER
jgi:hypothetical protein